jgi:hypothetical protein
MTETVRVYDGIVTLRDYGDGMGLTFLSDDDEPLAARVMDDCGAYGRYASVRYFVSDEPRPVAEMEENLVRKISGALDANFGDCYSEITGYLWTDEEAVIGGHDVIAEISTYEGRYVWLEIRYTQTHPNGHLPGVPG